MRMDTLYWGLLHGELCWCFVYLKFLILLSTMHKTSLSILQVKKLRENHSPHPFSCFAQLFSHVQLFATPRTVTHLAPLSMGFPRQEYWNGLPFPPPGHLCNPEIKPEFPMSPAWKMSLTSIPIPRVDDVQTPYNVSLVVTILNSQIPWK